MATSSRAIPGLSRARSARGAAVAALLAGADLAVAQPVPPLPAPPAAGGVPPAADDDDVDDDPGEAPVP